MIIPASVKILQYSASQGGLSPKGRTNSSSSLFPSADLDLGVLFICVLEDYAKVLECGILPCLLTPVCCFQRDEKGIGRHDPGSIGILFMGNGQLSGVLALVYDFRRIPR